MDRITIRFYFSKFMKDYERFPDSVLTALERIGGLIVALNFGFLLQYLHQKWYEQHMTDVVTTKTRNE
jgi:mannose/fructose/N-acetylgalactosamine-specific phosphotransferase system component IIC